MQRLYLRSISLYTHVSRNSYAANIRYHMCKIYLWANAEGGGAARGGGGGGESRVAGQPTPAQNATLDALNCLSSLLVLPLRGTQGAEPGMGVGLGAVPGCCTARCGGGVESVKVLKV